VFNSIRSDIKDKSYMYLSVFCHTLFTHMHNTRAPPWWSWRQREPANRRDSRQHVAGRTAQTGFALWLCCPDVCYRLQTARKIFHERKNK